MHALFLLMELRSKESLEVVLAFLANDDELIHFWMGDLFTEELWMVVAWCTVEDLEPHAKFILNDDINIYSRMVLASALCQLAINKLLPEETVIDWHCQVFEHFLLHRTDLDIQDEDLIADLVCNCADMKAKKLIPIIRRLYDESLVSIGYAGTFDEIMNHFMSDDVRSNFLEFKTIHEVYAKWIVLETENKEEQLAFAAAEHIIPLSTAFSKVQRNDPCPCGSGKKFKKCHGMLN